MHIHKIIYIYKIILVECIFIKLYWLNAYSYNYIGRMHMNKIILVESIIIKLYIYKIILVVCIFIKLYWLNVYS